MCYLNADTKTILEQEGLDFCQEHSIQYGTFAGENIVRSDDVRKALDKGERDSSKFYYMHEVPHVIWALNNHMPA